MGVRPGLGLGLGLARGSAWVCTEEGLTGLEPEGVDLG